ncbi:MAG: NAD(P)H-dependent oxidoreductase [Synergistaceae bacterium]|nr:NAD(P)H-dependent oxidoreductase [Synergistaceae bacterium]
MNALKVVVFSGSPRENGNTSRLVKVVLSALESEGISTKEVRMGNNKIRGCAACGQCHEKKLERCAFGDDPTDLQRAHGLFRHLADGGAGLQLLEHGVWAEGGRRGKRRGSQGDDEESKRQHGLALEKAERLSAISHACLRAPRAVEHSAHKTRKNN